MTRGKMLQSFFPKVQKILNLPKCRKFNKHSNYANGFVVGLKLWLLESKNQHVRFGNRKNEKLQFLRSTWSYDTKFVANGGAHKCACLCTFGFGMG
jgi:hypothetical protein